MKIFWNVCTLILAQVSLAQYVFVPEQSHLEVSKGATIHFSADAIISGSLHNEGLIELEQHADFGPNTTLGALKLVGASAQSITGSNLNVSTLEIDRPTTSSLTASQVTVTDELRLTHGILQAGWDGLEVLGTIIGGSESSFVQGKLAITNKQAEFLHYPVGHDGVYLPLSLENTSDSRLQVEAKTPEQVLLQPNEEMVAISDVAIWEVQHSGNVALNSMVTLGYPDMDPASVPQTNPIRSKAYSAIVSVLADSVFVPLSGQSEMHEVMPGGNARQSVVSGNALRLDNATAILGVGVVPVISGAEFYVPTVFVPSGQYDENKRFRAFASAVEVERVALMVWDQRNNKVFSEEVMDTPLEETGWDGLVQGGEAAQGVYYYSVKLETKDQGVFEQSGTVMLMR
ncbi:hypothetical protein [Marinoscillum furvescens]|uniref:Gliding motility-associated-like protein n=1 Tax=Marinoscillum furvescens DSM 4134 TaxID=1122208 RepID=A0A3D9L3U6_MARFU|nr:hypothetical protein [Marinoscillum furvescens]RED97028.1 hypothetical protein C7460_11377 [Marinoscillum furvescens DSM 4134]